ncbi:hypothetical protein D3C71_19130 [compost metagenome]
MTTLTALSQATLGYYADADGDIVQVLRNARSSVDASPVVLFERVMAADGLLWAAPLAGWHERYSRVDARPDWGGTQARVSALPEPARGICRHTDGGIYEVLCVGKNALDGSSLVIYEHLWPFETHTWTRPHGEWAERFTPITAHQYNLAVSQDRTEAQLMVNAAKQLRKNKAAKPKRK